MLEERGGTGNDPSLIVLLDRSSSFPFRNRPNQRESPLSLLHFESEEIGEVVKRDGGGKKCSSVVERVLKPHYMVQSNNAEQS